MLSPPGEVNRTKQGNARLSLVTQIALSQFSQPIDVRHSSRRDESRIAQDEIPGVRSCRLNPPRADRTLALTSVAATAIALQHQILALFLSMSFFSSARLSTGRIIASIALRSELCTFMETGCT
jgi:hypothetical protein